MCIVTGPRIELAIELIERMKWLFASSNSAAAFDTKETVIELYKRIGMWTAVAAYLYVTLLTNDVSS